MSVIYGFIKLLQKENYNIKDSDLLKCKPVILTIDNDNAVLT